MRTWKNRNIVGVVIVVLLLVAVVEAGVAPFAGELSSFHSFDRYDFEYAGRPCIVVVPKTIAQGKPWIWRARFFGHEPQADIALLKKGFHVAYIDVADLYGSPEAVSLWNQFYAYLTQVHGFSPWPALEGMSRGGLIIYNWAEKNPEKVSCIYGDAPVCDIKSWPGGKGAGPGSASDWAKCLKTYDLTEEQASKAKCNPTDHLEPLARANVPLLHVVGDADKVVPVVENTAILAKRYKALGGSIQVIHKPGIGHHPHSLKDPEPIVQFVLSNTTEPVRERIEWCDIWITNADSNDLPRVLLIGDSITRGYFGGVEKALAGKANCARLTTSRSICDPVFFDELKMVLAQYPFDVIHFNNGLHGWGYTESQYRRAFPELLNVLRQENPKARLIWATTTPVRQSRDVQHLDDEKTTRVRKRNEIALECIRPLGSAVDDLFALVIDHPEYVNSDGVHYNERGRAVQTEQIAQIIQTQMGRSGIEVK